MRRLVIKPNARRAIFRVADWVAAKYFPETGENYIDAVHAFLLRHSNISNLPFPPCKNKRLAKRKLSCIIYNRKWVIAFKYTAKEFVVYEFIWGGKLR